MTAPRPVWLARLAASCMLLAIAFFCILGAWQLQRLTWKLDLIERVNARLAAPAEDAPGPDEWASFDSKDNAYRRVRATGWLLRNRTTLVTATTELGQGFWVLAPLCSKDGAIRLINLGFVYSDAIKNRVAEKTTQLDSPCRDDPGARKNSVELIGLLRASEPGGGFLRKNNPESNRWYSRDVSAVASARGLNPVAPYFIDLDRASGDALQDPERSRAGSLEHPISGLTVVSFTNNHLVYAITWFALAVLLAIAGIKLMYTKKSEPHPD